MKTRILFLKNTSALITVLLLLTLNSFAASIPVFNTGVNNSGGLLGNTTLDPHYSLISAPGGYTTAKTGRGNEMALGLPWLAEGPASRWINPSGWLGEWMPTGTYTYRTTFSMSGLDASSATLSLKIASDNNCTVLLNGGSTGITTPFAGYGAFSNYSINSGFLSGMNTLDFVVSEPGSTPSGLRVELSGTANVVPEPSSLALFALAGALMKMRRK